jgi:anti-anti-sigma regulatory factor
MAEGMHDTIGLEGRPAWRDDVALEYWVDMEHVPILIRVAGTLDEATGPSLLSVVDDLLNQGVRHIGLETDQVHALGPGGRAAIAAAASMAERRGGTLHQFSTGPPADDAGDRGGLGPAPT